MKILLLFANSSVRKGLADNEELSRLLNEASVEVDQNVEIYTSFARSLSFFISNHDSVIFDHKNRLRLEDYDFVYFRKAGATLQQMLACAIYLRSHGVPFYDREIFHATSRNKLSQMFKLKDAGIPVPATLYCRHKKRMLRLVRKNYKDTFSFPLIAKATGGTRGDANYLVPNLEELDRIIRSERRHFLIQQYIPNNGDLRVLVGDYRVGGIIRRTADQGSHLNNTSKGAQAIWDDGEYISREVAHDVVQSAMVLGRDFAGVDVIFDKNTNDHYILEVNRAPQVEHASFPDKKARFLLDSILHSIDKYVPTIDVVTSLGKRKKVIGRFETVQLEGGQKVIAKIDTGADTSTLHCEKISEIQRLGRPELAFSFDGISVHHTSEYAKIKIKSSNGQSEERYTIRTNITIGRKKYPVIATLSKRDAMKYNVLLGRRFLRDHALIVDVARRFVITKSRAD